MKLLIEAGADVNSADKYGTTPLISITRNSQSDIQEHIEKYVKLLLDAGAKFGKVPGQSEEAIMNNCLMRGDWMSAMHLLEHGVALDKDQRDVLRSSGCAQVLEKMAIVEKAKSHNDDKKKFFGKTPQKKDSNVAVTDSNKKSPQQVSEAKDDESKSSAEQDKAENDVENEENESDSESENDSQGSDEMVDIEIDCDDDDSDENEYQEQTDLDDADTQRTQRGQESECTRKGETVPAEAYLSLKREHERVLEQVGKYLQMLVSEEDERAKAKQTIRELEEKVRLLEKENSSLRSTISELEMENQELHEQRQHRNGHRHLQYQQPSFLPRLQDFPPNDYMHTPFDFGPAPNPDDPLFAFSDDDSPHFYK